MQIIDKVKTYNLYYSNKGKTQVTHSRHCHSTLFYYMTTEDTFIKLGCAVCKKDVHVDSSVYSIIETLVTKLIVRV